MLPSLSKASFALPLLLAATVIAAPSLAQAPPGYYASVNTSSSSSLRSTLNAVIDDHQIFPYTSGSTDTWDILKKADQNPSDSGAILDVYKNKSFSKSSGGFNREHTWPNSLGFPVDNGKNYPYTDCHQLFLCDIGYNAARSNFPFGNAGPGANELTTLFTNGAGGGSGTYPGNSDWENGTVFEVWGDRRGDIARAMFYMDVRYEGGNHAITGWSEPDLILSDSISQIMSSATGQNESVAYMGLLSVLLQWHAQDPVDAKEMARNDWVFSYQGNRNPFIDHPEWIDCLFNGTCGADTTPPAAPTGLAAAVSGTTISLDWADNVEADLAGYRVWRSTTAGGPYAELTGSLQLTSDWLDSGLTSMVTYYYVVTAEDVSTNVSAQSSEASGTTTTGGGGTGTGLPWINELHYDNSGTDTGEFVEVAGPAGLDLAGFDLVGYNGNGGGLYSTISLSGQLADQGGCVGALAFPFIGLQNGAPDGIALVDPSGTVVEFLSYEGSLTAADGPAAGMVSVDIGVVEDFATNAGESLQLGGSGADATAFVWQSALAETPGAPNQNQTFTGGCSFPCGTSQYDLGASPANTIVLLGAGSPNVGGSIGLVTTNLPFGGAFYGISGGKTNLPLLGGVVLVDPFNLLLPLTFKASVTGTATFTVPIPSDPAFAGLTFYSQAFALDGGQPGGYSLSGGLEIIVCP
jgi:endonuclease I